MPDEPLYLLEQTDFSFRFARCASRSHPVRIEDLREIPVGAADALAAAALEVFPNAGTGVICALRPKPRPLHLTSSDEARRHAGLAGVHQFVHSSTLAAQAPAWYAAVQANDGAAPAGKPWLLTTSSAESHRQALAALEALKLKPEHCTAAAFSLVGAVSATVPGPILVLEVGELSSQVLLVGREGAIAVGAAALNLDLIAEAVQSELNLKFRGSAAKLFFNPDYDFSEVGGKIAARLAAGLKSDFAPLLAGRPAPTEFYCAGLPAAQQWFAAHLANALGLTPYAPDVKAWSAVAGVALASPALEASLSPAWLDFLYFINAQASGASAAWQAEWHSANAPVAPEAAPAPESVPVPVAKPAVTTPAPAPAKPIAAAPVSVAPVAKPVAPKSATPAKASESSVGYSSKPSAAAKSAPKKTAESAAAKPSAQPHASDRSPGRKKNPGLLIGLAAALILLIGGGFYYLQFQKNEAARLAAEKQKTELRLKAEQEKVRQAEQKAREEALARKKFEIEASQKLAASEAERQKAEAEARAQLAARLANARGTLVIKTEPAGASVAVGDLPPRPSPATFTALKIGKYAVTISLPLYEAAKLELEVKENATTDSGVVRLVSVVGGAELTTEPAGANYELHPAHAFVIAPDARRTGRTPALLSDLSPGDYAVTFTRDGWAPHSETVTVGRGTTVRAAWTFPNGAVKITSVPAGAILTRDGARLGVTPLVLADQPVGVAHYVATMDGFEPIPLSGRVEGGKTLELAAQFPPADRIYTTGQLDEKPEAIDDPEPELPYYLTLANGRVEIELVVTREGAGKNARVVSTTNPDLVKYCLEGVAKWRFKPGQIGGKPVNARVVVPIKISARRH
jgi:outer membrane biosynthesis protein TonB